MNGIPTDVAIWLTVAIVLAIIEITTVGLLFIFFAGGALLAAVAAIFLPDNYLIETLVFVVGSVLMLVFARPVLRDALNVKDKPAVDSNVHALLDKEVLVLEPVRKFEGKVKVVHTGEVWSAYLHESAGVDELPVDGLGKVIAIDGAKLSIAPK